jgi:hypothetical protein
VLRAASRTTPVTRRATPARKRPAITDHQASESSPPSTTGMTIARGCSESGDEPPLFGLATGGILYAAGLFVSGRWLRREAAVDESDVMATA